MTSHQPQAQAGSTTSPLSAEDLAQFESLSFGTDTGTGNGSARDQMTTEQQQQQQQRQSLNYQPPAGSPPLVAKAEEGQGQSQQQYQQQQQYEQQYQQAYAQSQPLYAQPPPQPQGMRNPSTFTTHGDANPEAPHNPYNPFLSGMAGTAQPTGQSQNPSMQQQDFTANMPSTNPFANPQSTYAAPATAPYNPPPTQPPTAFPMVEEHQASAVPMGGGGGVQGGNSTAPAPVPRQEDKAWPTKDVIFRGVDRKIVMQVSRIDTV
ncbi:hypothetical protein BCV69DRAFT_150307 [Microstroma glucosiphilum]|uniref:Uncharacterized protein n=1 Tax=Pseudomicrostroma glucosiphilum TaxID=1684307 RepID=A0A316UBN9_9BASI|nr:hypothetical protein BCV69DRAFT_150307 [Pseudomicrostroma glucosiphilum]PWN22579.1 hypothetical protein BCV69DRAFT_150307 [Pseudomicrostroma glucosiphilum]